MDRRIEATRRRARIGSLAGAALLALSAGHAQASGPGSPNDNRAYLTANGLLNRGLYELAIPEYQKFLQASPEHGDVPAARYGLGVCLFRLGRYGEAMSQFDSLADLEDFQFGAEVQLLRGHCDLATAKFDEAAASFATLVARYPDHDSADDGAALRAEALYRGGRFDASVEAADDLIDGWPDSPLRERTELFGGMAELARGNVDEASARFESMLERYPEGQHSAQATLLLARSLHQGGEAQRAVAQYRRVVDRSIDAYLPEALVGLGQLLHQAGAGDEAALLLDRMLEGYPDDQLADAARLQRARIYFDENEYDDARPLLEAVAQSEDEGLRDDAAYWLAKCDLREGGNAEAADALSSAIQRYPDSELLSEMTYDRAIALTRAGADESAIVALELFRSEYPDHELAPDALYTQASIEHQLERYDESLELCRRFLDRFDDHRLAAPAMFLLGENHFLSGRFDEAADAYTALLETEDADEFRDRATFRLGMSRYRQDRFELAQPLLESVTRGAETPEVFRPALLALGDGLFEDGQWAAAESTLSEYLAFGLDQPAADDALIKRGLARQRQGNPEGAIEDYDALLAGFEDSTHRLQAEFERGQALVELERWDDAEASFTVVLAQGEDSRFAPHAMNHLGVISQRNGDFSQAAEWFGRAGASGGEELEVQALYERGRALLAAREYVDAAGVLAGVAEEHPDHPSAAPAQAYRVIALARADRIDESLAAMESLESDGLESIEMPLRQSALYEKAWCLLEQGNDSAAGEAYRDLLATEPDASLRAYALLDLAGIEMRAGNHADAAPMLEETLSIGQSASAEMDPSLAERATYRLAACRLEAGRYSDVVDLLDEFHSQYPESDVLGSASLMCGESHLKLNQHSRAADHLERVVEIGASDESYGPGLLRLGEASSTLQRWDRALEAFSAYMDGFADSDVWFQAQFGIGWALENMGRRPEAIDAYQRVVDGHDGPSAARAQFQIGECLYADERYEDAIRELLEVDILYAYPEWSAAALYEAGRCFEALGQFDDARRQFEQVTERFADSDWAVPAQERLEAIRQSSTLPGR